MADWFDLSKHIFTRELCLQNNINAMQIYGNTRNKNRITCCVYAAPRYFDGGGGGFRTRVQKSSTDSSTYLALPFDLT